jgi:hypothetical protein
MERRITKEPIVHQGEHDFTFAGPYGELGMYHAYWRVPGDKDWRVVKWANGDYLKLPTADDACLVAARYLVGYLNEGESK